MLVHLDAFSDGRFLGWACDRAAENEPVRIEVTYDGKVICEALADIPRGDLNAIGIAGDHGFDFKVPFLPSPDASKLKVSARPQVNPTEISIEAATGSISDFYGRYDLSKPLRPPSHLWGADILRDDPPLTIHEDVIYVPEMAGAASGSAPRWGLYTSEGRLITESSWRRGESLSLVNQVEEVDIDVQGLEFAPFDTMIYGGIVFGHYGHFLISTLSRCWAIDGSAQVLFHSVPPFRDHGAPFIVDVMRAAGLAKIGHSFDRPMRLRKVLVPQAAFHEQHSVTHAYARAMAGIGRYFEASPMSVPKKVYLSKSRLPGGVVGFEGERTIEARMEAAGFTIVYPETISLHEQIGIFRHAELIVGMAGSAFHTLALAPFTQAKRVIFTYEDSINSNFVLLDRVCGGSASYYSLNDAIERMEKGPFDIQFRATNPDYVAEKMVHAAMNWMPHAPASIGLRT